MSSVDLPLNEALEVIGELSSPLNPACTNVSYAVSTKILVRRRCGRLWYNVDSSVVIVVTVAVVVEEHFAPCIAVDHRLCLT